MGHLTMLCRPECGGCGWLWRRRTSSSVSGSSSGTGCGWCLNSVYASHPVPQREFYFSSIDNIVYRDGPAGNLKQFAHGFRSLDITETGGKYATTGKRTRRRVGAYHE